MAPLDDLTLANADTRTVATTGYQLTDKLWGRGDGGNRYRRLVRSLGRLASTRVLMQLVERDPELAMQRVTSGNVNLIGTMWLATHQLDLRKPSEWGALKGSTSLKIEIGRWPAQQVLAGRCTWLDLDLLRALGNGLPGRLWPAIEAWSRWPARTLDDREEETAIGLGTPALHSLGVGDCQRPRKARELLDRAGARIVATDPAYSLVRCEQRAGWCLVVRRLCGAKARATARKSAPFRDVGAAVKAQQRAERLPVRATIRRQLAEPEDRRAA